MVYVPIITTSANVDDSVFRNVLRIVDEYQVANSSIITQDTEVKKRPYPIYTLYVAEISRHIRDTKTNGHKVTAHMQIDFDALISGGYKQTTAMHQAIETGLDTENDNLQTARLRYTGSEVLDARPIDINGQQILSKAVRFDFEVLI